MRPLDDFGRSENGKPGCDSPSLERVYPLWFAAEQRWLHLPGLQRSPLEHTRYPSQMKTRHTLHSHQTAFDLARRVAPTRSAPLNQDLFEEGVIHGNGLRETEQQFRAI